MPGDDEQGVVDADRQADHQRQHGRGRDDLEGAGHGEHPGHRDPDPDQCGEQREPGRDQRPQGDHQDQPGHDQADHLAAVDLGHLVVGVAAEGHRDTGRAGRVGRRPDRVALLVGDVAELAVEGDQAERDRAVRGDRAGGVRVGDARDTRDGGDPGDRLADGPGVLGARDAAGRVAAEDHLGRAVALGREGVLDPVQGGLGLGPGDLELLGGLAAEGRGAAADRDQQGEPDGEDGSPPAEAEAAQAVQVRGHACTFDRVVRAGGSAVLGRPVHRTRNFVA